MQRRTTNLAVKKKYSWLVITFNASLSNFSSRLDSSVVGHWCNNQRMRVRSLVDESLSDDKLLFLQCMRVHERLYNFGCPSIIKSRWRSGLDTEHLIVGKEFESRAACFSLV